MQEHDLMNMIRLELSRRGFAVFRANVGRVRMNDGRFFNAGLPNGFSDLFAVRDGRIYFLEVKVKPNKPTRKQLDFLAVMCEKYGAAGGVVYSVDDALKAVGYE